MWTDEDQDKVHALLQERMSVCSRCGTRPEDWVDEKGMPLAEPVYETTTRRCHGCAEISREQETIPPKEKGIAVVLTLRKEDDDGD